MKRHPAEVTADRLVDAVEKWGDRLYGNDLINAESLAEALREIAREDRER